MVTSIDKKEISIVLLTGIILAIFVLIGTFTGNFLLEIINTFFPKCLFTIKFIFLIIFVILSLVIIRVSLKNLINPASTDYHKITNLVKKILFIK